MNQVLAENIVSLRKKQGMSQEQLAEKLNVSRQAVSNWERGIAVPDVETLTLLAQLFDTDLTTMVNGESGKAEGAKDTLHNINFLDARNPRKCRKNAVTRGKIAGGGGGGQISTPKSPQGGRGVSRAKSGNQEGAPAITSWTERYAKQCLPTYRTYCEWCKKTKRHSTKR